MELVRDQVEALDLWRRVTVTTVRSDAPDLTARQLAVLMTVRLQPAPHTVRGLAATLNVGKPAITRALDTLSRLGFVQRAAALSSFCFASTQSTPPVASTFFQKGARVFR